MDHNQESTTGTPDPLVQAGALLLKFCTGRPVAVGGVERQCAALIASVLYAQAAELRRVGDLLESLVEAAHQNGLAQDLVDILAAQHAGRNGGG